MLENKTKQFSSIKPMKIRRYFQSMRIVRLRWFGAKSSELQLDEMKFKVEKCLRLKRLKIKIKSY